MAVLTTISIVIYKPFYNHYTMWLYTMHYLFLNGEVYAQRDFKIQYSIDKSEKSAGLDIDKIMDFVFNGYHVFFQKSEIERHETQIDKGKWLVIDELHPYRKYPKKSGWGNFNGVMVTPIDWRKSKRLRR